MRSFASGSGCLMKFLQTALDDPDPSACGRCSVCTGVAPGPGTRPSRDWIRLARDFSRGIDVIVEPRKRWPSGSVQGPYPRPWWGRAVAYADDPGWAPVGCNDLFRLQEIPESLLEGAVEALKRWAKPGRTTNLGSVFRTRRWEKQTAKWPNTSRKSGIAHCLSRSNGKAAQSPQKPQAFSPPNFSMSEFTFSPDWKSPTVRSWPAQQSSKHDGPQPRSLAHEQQAVALSYRSPFTNDLIPVSLGSACAFQHAIL